MHVTAVNHVTDEPLTDIFISIVATKQGALFNSSSDLVAEGWTDENGQFYFGWKAKRNASVRYEYIVQADPVKYYQVEFQQIDYLTKGEEHHYEIRLAPKGLLRLNYKNVNCFDQNDEMFVHYINCLEVPSNNITPNPEIDTHYGCNIDIQTSYSTEPAGTYEYYYHVKRNGVTSYYTDTVYIEEGQQSEIMIHY